MDNHKSDKSNLNNIRDFFLSLIKSEEDKNIIRYLYGDEDMELVVKKLIGYKDQKKS